MLKPPLNPQAIELLKTCTDRSIALDLLKTITIEGIKMCAWCHSQKTKIKYCGQDCALSAQAHLYPQKEIGLNYLLIRQDFKCASCQYDYRPLIEQLLINGRVYNKPKDYTTQISYYLMRKIKRKSPPDRKPEVDHVIPVSKGGQTLSLSNHQAICYTCHKTKTSQDLSGPRKKKI